MDVHVWTYIYKYECGVEAIKTQMQMASEVDKVSRFQGFQGRVEGNNA